MAASAALLVSKFLRVSSNCTSNPSFALLILNQELPQWTPLLWKEAHLRICADGGANRLYHGTPLLEREKFLPDYIIGDLDSIEDGVKHFYSSKGVKIVDKSHDQDTTDLHKCVSFIKSEHRDLVHQIIVLGALGGRFDHEMGNLNVLYSFPDVRIVLLSEQNVIFLLPNGRLNKLQAIPGSHCGLIPLGSPSHGTTTTGLKWNLDDKPMSFGALVSTSNKVENENVTVLSDVDLLWTIEISCTE